MINVGMIGVDSRRRLDNVNCLQVDDTKVFARLVLKKDCEEER